MPTGKYTGTTTDEQAFAVEDITFYNGLHCLDNKLCSNLELEAATSTTYCITKPENGHKGNSIAHTTSGNMLCCPVRATVCQFMMYCHEFCCSNKSYSGKIKLASYFNSKFVNVSMKSALVINFIQTHAGNLRSKTGVNPKEFTSCSLCAGGVMALLLNNVIKLLST